MTVSPSSPAGPPTGAVTGTSPSRIIRRAPTGTFPAATGASTALPTGGPTPVQAPGGRPPAHSTDFFGGDAETRSPQPGAAIPIAACVIAIVSGWASAVVATDLIASWWHTDRLFCLAVGLLMVIFAGTTVTGMVLLLRRRWPGGHLIAIGAVVALLTFGSLFLAGARVPTVVHLIPLLQVASAVLALHPASSRWVIR